MKKILFAAFAASLLAAGCQKTEVSNMAGEPALSFTTDAKKLTKSSEQAPDAAAIGTDYNLQAQDFRVWVYAAEDFDHTPQDDAGQIYDGMQNLSVVYGNGTWGTTLQYFWPGKDKELKFFAVSANDDLYGESGNASTVVLPNASDNTMQIQDFSIESPNYNVDLMIADYVEQNQNQKAVNLNFRHTLSKVEFVFNTISVSGISVFVQKLEVLGLVSKGTLDVTYKIEEPSATSDEYQPQTGIASFEWNKSVQNPQTGDFTDDWNTVYQGENFPEEIEGEVPTEEDKKAMEIKAKAGETPGKEDVFTTWLMIPQNIENKKVKITYLLNERKVVGEFPLSVGNIKDWKDNQYIRYVVTLSPNMISFNASTTDWTHKPENDDITHEN